MLSIRDKLSIAQYLKSHPLQQEPEVFKKKYLGILAYLAGAYVPDDRYAASLIRLYQQVLLPGGEGLYPVSSRDVSDMIRAVSRGRLRGWRLLTYRDMLVVDSLFLCTFGDEQVERALVTQFKACLGKRAHRRVDELLTLLDGDGPVERRYALAAESITRWRENLAYLRRPTRTILLTANMSAGKSTLLNALVGKQISKTQNAACTAKCHYIYSKAFEDGFNYEYDYLLDLNADQETLMNDNSDKWGLLFALCAHLGQSSAFWIPRE